MLSSRTTLKWAGCSLVASLGEASAELCVDAVPGFAIQSLPRTKELAFPYFTRLLSSSTSVPSYSSNKKHSSYSSRHNFFLPEENKISQMNSTISI